MRRPGLLDAIAIVEDRQIYRAAAARYSCLIASDQVITDTPLFM
ncbi:unnamed protein product [Penicillium roqueforti FM164]|uniref:Genomic scaffold, ProqFM164S02 n=1 Tax=Penicillium roqueforti (strain FM164) TaxID=1365484 RepID=W6Q6J9_PENRF|nr:unnamed protein product [Penicillium roqueforti FM164]